MTPPPSALADMVAVSAKSKIKPLGYAASR